MRQKQKIHLVTLSAVLFLALAGAGSAQAQARHLQHTVSVRVPSVVKIIPDPIAVGPTGLPVFRVITNDPVLRRRLEQGADGGLVAEALAADSVDEAGTSSDFRFTVVTP